GDDAVPQVEHLEPAQQPGADDLGTTRVAQVRDPQLEVCQTLEVGRAGDGLKSLQPDVRLPSWLATGVQQEVSQVAQGGVGGKDVQRVVVQVIDLQDAQVGQGRQGEQTVGVDVMGQ